MNFPWKVVFGVILPIIVSIIALYIAYKSYQFASLRPSLNFEYESLQVEYDTFGAIENSLILFDPPPTTYILDKRRLNAVIIENTSGVVASDVYIDIAVENPFVIASVSLEKSYPIRHQEITSDDKQEYVSIKLRRILGNDSCKVVFSYAYPKNVQKESQIASNSLAISVECGGSCIKNQFSLEY